MKFKRGSAAQPEVPSQAPEPNLNGVEYSRFKQKPAANPNQEQAWAEWLSDTPPAPAARTELRQQRVHQANTPRPRPGVPVTPKADPAPAAVSIQINLPEWRKPQFKRSKAAWRSLQPHLTRSRIITVSIIAGVLLAGWLGLHLLKVHNDQRSAQAARAALAKVNPALTQPSFTPVVPSTRQELITPDGVHSKYDANKGSYAFNDSIGGKLFTVSEQKVPAGQKAIDIVATAAKSLNAKTPLETGWGTAYLLTNQKYNSQTLILSVKDLLIFIQSSFVFTNDQWTSYINSLQ